MNPPFPERMAEKILTIWGPHPERPYYVPSEKKKDIAAALHEYGEACAKEKLADFTISLEASFVAQAVANARRSSLEEATKVAGCCSDCNGNPMCERCEAMHFRIRALFKEKKS